MNQFKQLQTFKRGFKMTAKTLLFLIALIAGLSRAQAQLTVSVTNSGNTTPNLASSYSSLASAIADLNAVTAFSGPVTLTCSGTSETAPTGGFVITYTAATTGTNNVVINGGNKTIRAAAIATAGGATTGQADAVIKIVGSDNLTIQNFTITENSSNTVEGALAAQKMTEFGIALFAASATDGAQNNTIQNNTITLSNGATTYRNAIGIFSSTTAAHTAPATARAATSIAGTNSNNKIYGNTISGVAHGIYFVAPPQTVTVFESGIDIGGTSLSTGNNITIGVSNTASDLTWTSYSGAVVAGVYFRNSVLGFNVSYNTFTNKAGLTLASGAMYNTVGTAPAGIIPAHTSSFNYNSVTLTQTSVASIYGADFGGGLDSLTSMECNNNTITINHTAIAANSAADYFIKANYGSANANFNNNILTYNGFTISRTASITNSGAIYGLYVSGGLKGSRTTNVLGNTLNLNKTDSMAATWTSTFSGATYGIYPTIGANTMNIGSATAGTGNTININDSIVTGGGTAAFTYTQYAIYNGAGSGNLNVINNSITTGRSGKCRTSGSLYGFYYATAITTGFKVSNNSINVDRSGTVPGTGGSYGLYLSGGHGALVNGYSVDNNTITWVGPTVSGVCYGIYSFDGSAAGSKLYTNNTVNVSGSPSTVYGLYTYNGFININNNTFNLTTSYASSPTMYGIYQGSTWATGDVYQNTFSNMTATGLTASAPTIVAVYLASTTTGTLNVRDNVISNMSAAGSTGSAQLTGIYLTTGGLTSNIFRNKIYNLNNNSTGATAAVYLLRITSGQANGTANIYNNLISHTSALTGFTNPIGINGIYITSTTATFTMNVYYNTVYLSTSSTGANFGGFGLFHTTSTTATTATLNLRNNIIVNNITPTGTGFAYAYKRSSTALNNYATTSNNNLFYCGAGIYNDGTNTASTISAFKGYVSPREGATVSESLTWLNTSSPAGANFLKLDPTISTQVESGAVTITGFNDDYNTVGARASYPLSAQTYGGGLAPDMGAQEMDLIPADFTGPSIVYTPIPNSTNTSTVTLTATITDASGVPTSGAGLPVLYWRTGNTGSYNSVTATWVSGSTYTFTFGGGNANDLIVYFIAAQDNAGTPNVSVTGVGSTGLSTNPPACASAPTTTNSYTILSAWNGTYVIGGNAAGPASGADYVSLGEALADVTPNQIKSIYLSNGGSGFSAVPTITFTGGGGSGATATAYVSGGAITRILVTNSGTGYTSAPTVVITSATGTGAVATANVSSGKALGGPVTLSLSTNYDGTLYEGIFPITIPSMGQTATNTLTIKPAAGASPNIVGNSGTAIIDLYGADFTTIDGSNNGTSSRNLSIQNTNVGTYATVLRVTSLGLGAGATNNTLKNMNISGVNSTAVNFGIFVGGLTIISSGADNDTLTISNNALSNIVTSMYIYGTTAVSAGANDNLVVSNNTITINSTPQPLGLQIGNAQNALISGNIIDVIGGTNSYYHPIGISLETGFLNSVVENNKIVRMFNNYGYYGSHGITVGTGSATSNVTIRNNTITGIISHYTSSTIGYGVAGIMIGVVGNSSSFTTVAGGINIYNNSIYLSGNYVNTINYALSTTSTQYSYGIYIGSNASALNIKNNVVMNDMVNPGATKYTGTPTKAYAIYSVPANTAFTSIDYNTFFSPNTSSQGVAGYLGGDDSTLTQIQTAFGSNTNSKVVDPQFNSAKVLMPNIGSPIIAAGTPISGLTLDIIGATRNISTPSMGAFENGGDGAAPVILYTALKNTQASTSRSFNADIQDLGSSAVGVNLSTYAPRIYFKKSTDANSFGVANNSTGNGWKYVVTSSTTNPYTMNMDYSLLQSALNTGDVIQYFVAAQDNNGNYDANPTGGLTGTDINNLVTSPTTPNSYIVIGPTITAGTYTIGTSVASTYPTITAAAADIALRGISGPVVYELVDTSYTAATETFPISFLTVNGASATNTITMRPVSSASYVRVGTTNANGLFINDNGGSRWIWDGRAGGTGTTPVLYLENHSTTGSTVMLRADAIYNTYTYCNIKGSNSSYGTIYFNNALSTRGCDSNTFSYNNIYDGYTKPYYAVYLYGTNDANTLDANSFIGNNIYNFSQYGIYNSYYTNYSNITGNSFYTTSPTTTHTYFIYAYYPTYGAQRITNNYLGGSAPQCGGSAYTFNGTSALMGFYIYQGANNGATMVTGNTFKNFAWTTTSASTTSSFVYFYNGRAHIDNNIIGDQSSINNIVYNSSGTSATFQMIGTATGTMDTVTINNNQFGGITFNQVSGAGGTSLRAIDCSSSSTGYFQINNNTIGGTVANSLTQNTANSILALSIRTSGSSSNYAQQVKNNIVRNCKTSLASSSIQGLIVYGPPSIVTNNTVTNLTSAGADNYGMIAGFAGSAVTASNISGNVIHTLRNTGATGSAFTGLQLTGSTQSNVSATKNFIHSIVANVAGNRINGILVSGNYNVNNNMVRLGVDENGADITTSTSFNGFNVTSGSVNGYFNTVLVTGSNVGTGTDSSYAIRSTNATGTNIYRNNIFANTRTSGTSTGKHYAATYGGTSTSPAGLTLNNNNYYTTSAPLAFYNGANRADLSAFKAGTGLDANSMSEAPVFVAPNGTNSTVDLHIVPATQTLMESGGTNIAGITTDFDGDARPGPVGSTNGGGVRSDIGADEFDGSLFPIDMGAQVLVNPLGTCATSGKTVTIRIKNYSSNKTINFAVNPVTVYASVSGPNPTSFGSIYLNTDTLQAGATKDLTFTTNYDMSTIGTYTFDAFTSVIGDAGAANDAMASTDIVISALTAGTISSNFTSACKMVGAPTFTTTATGGNIQWVSSTVSNNGPWTNVGTNSTSYTPSSALSQTTYVTALISCNSSTIAAGDTIALVVPVLTSTTPGSRCGTGTVNLSATAGLSNDINWYTTSTGGIAVGSGSTFTTPTISSTTNYYAAAAAPGSNSVQVPGGNTWDQYTTVGGFQTTTETGASMGFDALSGILISTLDIYPAAAIGTTFTINVRAGSGTGTIIASYTGVTTVQNTGATPTVAQTVPVNFVIPAGTNYSIGFSTNPNTWRTYQSSNIPYPFTVPGIINIQASAFGTTPATTLIYQYYFYNWVLGAGCESARQLVAATVNTPPALALSANNAGICIGSSSNTISITPATVSNYNTYSWTPNTNISGNSSTGYVFNPSVTTTYTLSASQTSGSLCATNMDFTVSVNPLPSAVTVSPSMATYAAGSKPVKLKATGGKQSASGTLGNGTTTQSATGLTPFSIFYEGAHEQFLVTKAELNAMGIYAGDITSLGFNVTTAGGVTYTGGGTAIMVAFKIKMGHTAATSMSTAYLSPVGGFTNVYGPVSLVNPGVGMNVFTFNNNFTWDGNSNVVIDICHDNDITATCTSCYATNPTVSAHTTAATMVYGTYNDNAQACGVVASVTAGPSTTRPDMAFTYQAPATITWSPITNLFVDSTGTSAYSNGRDTATVYSAPTANRIYTVTATNRFGCTSQTTDTVIFINSASVSLTAFLQGMYLGSGTMAPAPFNANGISPTSIADTITVELHDPSNTAITAYSSTTTLSTSGIANVTFPGGAIGNSYYIYIKHRNSITTSSASPVQINSSNTSFNFSSALTQAYGSNNVDLGSGVFGIYTGDINQDGSVDFNDYPDLDIASSNGVLGYDPNDLNGDASVDFNDYPLIDVNSSNGVIAILP